MITPLEPPRRRTAADEAEHALFQGIMNGTIPPGAPLRLQDLAEQLDMSMMPIREALRRLDGLGLVEIVPHKGAWVRPLTREDLFDTYFARMHLEGAALSAAARRFTEQDARSAREALEAKQAAERAGDLIAARDAHEEFHFSLYRASGSSWLVRAIWPLWRNSERYRVESMRHPDHVRARDVEHVAMLEALERGDAPGAVAPLFSHLRSSVELVADALEPGDGPTVDLPTVDDIVVGQGDAKAPAAKSRARKGASKSRG